MKKTMERIVCILLAIPIGLLVIQSTEADANITVDIQTTGPVNSWMDINTNDSVSIVIDGANWTNIPFYIEDNEDEWIKDKSGISLNHLVRIIEDSMALIRGEKSFPSSWHYRIANAFMSVFVTKPEMQEVQQQNEFLLYRIEALENTMEKIAEKEYCQARVDTMIEYELNWIMCQNVTYYNMNGKGIAITGVE